jgi:hypothetical protein
MTELSTNYPEFYLNLSSYLANYSNEAQQQIGGQKQLADVSLQVSFPTEKYEESLRNASIQPDFVQEFERAIRQLDFLSIQKLLREHSFENFNTFMNGKPVLLFLLAQRPLMFPEITSLVKLLVRAGAQVNVYDKETQKSCLHLLLQVITCIFCSKIK